MSDLTTLITYGSYDVPVYRSDGRMINKW